MYEEMSRDLLRKLLWIENWDDNYGIDFEEVRARIRERDSKDRKVNWKKEGF